MAKDILEEIVAHKRIEIEQQKAIIAPAILYSSVDTLMAEDTSKHRSMRESLANSASGIIAEFKRKSPSKGWIKEEGKPDVIPASYSQNGASAISILTDEKYFGGSLRYLRTARPTVTCPILRKDFIVDEYQLYQAKMVGADAVLLIAADLTKEECKTLAKKAHQLQLETLLEVHAEAELEYVGENIDMVGVNNRNLGTFHTDVANSYRLASLLPKDYLLVSESGISNPQTVRELREAGFRGFLIGETFMKTEDPGAALSIVNYQLSTVMIIKVCGMREPENIRQVDELGKVDWMGFIFYPPSSRHVSEVPDYLPKHSKRVGVFVNATHEEIQRRQEAFGFDIIQLHGNESPDFCKELHHHLKAGTQLIKMIAITSPEDLEKTHPYEGIVDYFLFETQCSGYGGSGQQFDWNILQHYTGKTPFLITGGIGPEDAERIKTVNCQLSTVNFIGIDLNSRFETAPALKDITLIDQFIKQIKA